MADNDDIKKVLIPKDKDGNGELGNNFPNYDVPRPYVPVRDSGEDDLPFEGQPIQNGTVPVSIRSARQRAGQDSLINRNQIGASETLESDRQYLPKNRAASTINRPSHTRTLGDFLKKGDLGVRTNASRPRQADAIPGDTLLRSVNPPSPGSDPLNPFGSRVKGTPGPEYGNQLVEEGAGPVVERTVSAVLNQNRFSSIATPNVYAPSQQNPDQATFTSTQGLLGSYTPAGDNQRELSLEDMKSVAMDLIEAAMGMKNGVEAPGVKEGSSRIVASDVRVKNLTGMVRSSDASNAQQVKGSDGEFFEPGIGEVKSYGQLNSPDSFFDGLAPLEMITLAFATLAVSAAYLTGGSLLLGIANAITGEDSSPGTKPYSLGSFQKTNLLSRTVSSLISREDFGLIYTRASLSDSLQAGIASLLGIGGSTNLGSVEGAAEVARALANITRSPGFYVVFSRAILRDITELRDKIGNLSSIAPGQPGAFTFLDVLKTSKVVGGINALAAVGDALLTGDTSPFNLDKLTDAPMKSRSGTGKGETASDLRLAWRNSSSPSMLLLSPDVVFGQVALASNARSISAMSSMESTIHTRPDGRIPQESVKKIEAQLDAEYVPFYFHDLRTNEIVSLELLAGQILLGFIPTLPETLVFLFTSQPPAQKTLIRCGTRSTSL